MSILDGATVTPRPKLKERHREVLTTMSHNYLIVRTPLDKHILRGQTVSIPTVRVLERLGYIHREQYGQGLLVWRITDYGMRAIGAAEEEC